MTIKEYISQVEPETINGVTFFLADVNFDEELDVNDKTSYDCPNGIAYSFLERLQMAREEIKKDMEDNDITNLESAYLFYKRNTEEGNSNYWGGMISVWTAREPEGALLYDVRMD